MKKLVVLSLAVMVLVALPALAKPAPRTAMIDADYSHQPQKIAIANSPKLPNVGTEVGTTWMDWPSNGNVMNQISIDGNGGVHFSWTFENETFGGSTRRYMYNYRGADGSYLGPTAYADIPGARWGSSGCTYDGIGLGAFYATIAGKYPPLFSYDAGEGLGVFTTDGADSAGANALPWGGAWWNRLAVNRNPGNSDTIYMAAQGPAGNGTGFNRSYDLGQTWNTWMDLSFDGTMGFRSDFPSQQVAAGAGGRLAVAVVDSYDTQIYRISEDYGVTWGNVQIAVDPVTTDPNGDTVIPYLHTHVFFDNDNYLHILNSYYSWNYNSIGDSTLVYVGIFDWSENNGFRYVTRELTSEVQWYAYNTLNYGWPCMTQHADGTMMVVFAYFDSIDVAANGYANGDIWYTLSKDGGANWYPKFNLTNSQSPGAAAGSCEDDAYPDCAVFGDSLHITWLWSPDAGQAYQSAPGTVDTENKQYHAVFHFEVGVAGGPTAQPTHKLALNQNRPNPVRANTEISFSLPKAGDYSLKIYNVTGQTVKEFRGQGQAGANSVSWNAGKVTNGIYFYKLSSGGSTAAKRMVVVK